MAKKHVALLLGVTFLGLVIFTLVFFGIYGRYLFSNMLSFQNQEPVLHQITPIYGNYQLVWERTDLEIFRDREAFIATGHRKFIAVGRISSQQYDAIRIIDDTGVTSINSICPSSVASLGDLIFVGNCTSEVTALDFAGNRIWKHSLPNEGNITRLIASNDALYVYTEINNIYRFSLAGSLESKLDLGCSSALITAQAVYSRCGEGLSKIDLPSNTLSWQIYLDEALYGLPLVEKGHVIFIAGREHRNLQVFDAANGVLRWRTADNDIVSNVAVQSDLLFYLTAAGELVGKEIETGRIKVSLQLDTDKTENRIFAEGPHYLIASQDLLFLYTGDTQQLFVIRITEEGR